MDGFIAQDSPALDVQEYVEWFRDLNRRYSFGETEWAAIQDSIAALERRNADKTLYLGIVGEFSSGKSTFINALLRDDFLKADILAATTCALTFLEFGAELEARVVLTDGTESDCVAGETQTDSGSSITAESIQAIRQAVHKYTADEKESKRVSQVRVRYPNEQLRRGFAIIDTPGINVESKRHAAVTENALVNIFDACIVVIPAVAPCSEVLMNFLNTHIAPHGRECIVVATKIDLIRPAERDRLMKHIAGTLEAQTTLKVAAIYDVAPLQMNRAADGADDYVAQFKAAERNIMDHLAVSRQRIIASQLHAILLSVLRDIQAGIEARASEYRRKREYLDANRLVNLDEYVQRKKTGCHETITVRAGDAKKKLLQDLASTVGKLHKRGEIDIVNVANKTELRSVIEGNLLARVRANLVAVGDRVDGELETIVQCAQDAHAGFQKDFIEKYRVLDVLGGAVTSDELDKDLEESIDVNVEDAEMGTASIVTSVNRSQTVKHAGAGAGAIIGSFITPGIGTVIGGAAGWLVGSVFGPGLGTLKQRALEGAQDDVEALRSECEKLIFDLIAAYEKSVVGQLDGIVENYSAVYSARVQELIAELDAEKTRLDQYARYAEQDVAMIRERTAAIDCQRASEVQP